MTKKTQQNIDNELVRYSRAGDVFHYRWAARRCLRMIHLNSLLKCVMIEGSKEKETAGEYVIDVAEYYDIIDSDNEEIIYYQLKHSTKRINESFNLSDLKDTIEGFADRYSGIFCEDTKNQDIESVKFSIVTNRPISNDFKTKIFSIGKGYATDNRFKETLKKYTQLKDEHLQKFCSLLEFIDGEGNYNAQRYELHFEISQLLAGSIDNAQIDSIVALVQDQVMPNASGKLVREDILKRFGVTSERDLFPAPSELEEVKGFIRREQHNDLLADIQTNSEPIIIHAGGGVGKSVVSHQLAESLPTGSLGIVYDCFGSGKYRNRSEPRHRHRDALVQIANEIAAQGLCEPLIPRSNDLDDALLRVFLNRIENAAKSLRKTNNDNILAIFIDAADNAEMAAKEFSEPCFANQLLREKIPDGCRLIMLCRTERIHLLNPLSRIKKIELEPFSKAETLIYFKNHFPEVTDSDGLEFHRLTGGNPRVQANAIDININKISDILNNLGPSGSTVDEQIAAQLETAILRIKEVLPDNFQYYIEPVCLGLANLPPLIPINVLAKAAGVDIPTIISFISDLGRPIWLSDNFVQFRDEPTETWFREKYSASTEQIETFITRIKPLALKYSYVAEALPSLLLQAKNYDQLMQMAFSDDFLPEENPIDQRNIRVYRLQFAFKAALKQKKYNDAIKLALLAGEEVSSDNRQLEILKMNIDLIAPLQSHQRLQELAFRRMLKSTWDGSENVYSAALLSSVEGNKGEARGYLRAANNWVNLYFEEQRKSKDNTGIDYFQDDDILELAFIHYNLFGAKGFVDYICKWQPPQVIFRVTRLFIKRLIDAGNFDTINEISRLDTRNQYIIIAITEELNKVGKFPPADVLHQCLDLLIHKKARISVPNHILDEDNISSAIISFTEACSAMGLSHKKILRILKHYLPLRASRSITHSSSSQDRKRSTFLRGVALKAIISNNYDPDIELLMPKEFLKKNMGYDEEQNLNEFKQVIGSLLPWFIIRSRILIGETENMNSAVQNAYQRSKDARMNRWKEHDHILIGIARIRFEIIMFDSSSTTSELKKFPKLLSDDNFKFLFEDHLKAVRVAYRLEHLSEIRNQLEESCYKSVASASDEGPETRAGWYIDLSRAVLPVNQADAAAYFNYAIEAVSKFGDEVVERWGAIIALAKRYSKKGGESPEIAYRFIRCAELVGENVAREKYFNRNEAISVCAKLNSSSAFAALSRWRDRDIGWFDRQISVLAYESIESNILSPSVGWSLSAFEEIYKLEDFAKLCIDKESNLNCRQSIFDTAIRDLRLKDNSETNWEKLYKVAQKYSLDNKELYNILAFLKEKITKSNKTSIDQIPRKGAHSQTNDIDWECILHECDITKSVGLSKAIDRFKEIQFTHYSNEFWKEIYNRIPEKDAISFLKVVIDTESLDFYDINDALTYFPKNWRNKVSVKRNWPNIIWSIAKRFATYLSNDYMINQYLIKFCENVDLVLIHQGILEGLSESSILVDASTFFGFVEITSSFISHNESGELLDFALSRFEEHIDNDFADGQWADWLTPPESITDAFTGFVWAALGSPHSTIRWQGAHCVRRLAENKCQDEIDALIEWMHQDKISAFGSSDFPFYNLHARQYLLIALARVAINRPEILKKHYEIFSHQALKGIQHILIKKYAAQTALFIEKAFPKTYEPNVIEELRQVGISQFPIKKIDKYGENFTTPWHAKGEIDESLKVSLSFDFDRYWLEPLGNVFGVSLKQVEKLVYEIILNEWQIKRDSFLNVGIFC